MLSLKRKLSGCHLFVKSIEIHIKCKIYKISTKWFIINYWDGFSGKISYYIKYVKRLSFEVSDSKRELGYKVNALFPNLVSYIMTNYYRRRSYAVITVIISYF